MSKNVIVKGEKYRFHENFASEKLEKFLESHPESSFDIQNRLGYYPNKLFLVVAIPKKRTWQTEMEAVSMAPVSDGSMHGCWDEKVILIEGLSYPLCLTSPDGVSMKMKTYSTRLEPPRNGYDVEKIEITIYNHIDM